MDVTEDMKIWFVSDHKYFDKKGVDIWEYLQDNLSSRDFETLVGGLPGGQKIVDMYQIAEDMTEELFDSQPFLARYSSILMTWRYLSYGMYFMKDVEFPYEKPEALNEKEIEIYNILRHTPHRIQYTPGISSLPCPSFFDSETSSETVSRTISRDPNRHEASDGGNKSVVAKKDQIQVTISETMDESKQVEINHKKSNVDNQKLGIRASGADINEDAYSTLRKLAANSARIKKKRICDMLDIGTAAGEIDAYPQLNAHLLQLLRELRLFKPNTQGLLRISRLRDMVEK